MVYLVIVSKNVKRTMRPTDLPFYSSGLATGIFANKVILLRNNWTELYYALDDFNICYILCVELCVVYDGIQNLR